MNLQLKFTQTRQALVESLRIIGILQGHVHAADALVKACENIDHDCYFKERYPEQWATWQLTLASYRSMREPCEASKVAP